MRLWSIHPKYLDAKGLVALWREGLLAKKVLEGKTIGYRNHPQLIRFKQLKSPITGINAYLAEVYKEACARSYCFDGQKLRHVEISMRIAVTRGQADYEFLHMKKKLKIRDRMAYLKAQKVKVPELNPVFRAVKGGVEPWERINF